MATGGTTYVWTPTVGLSDPNIANPIAAPDATTTYQVRISNPGCAEVVRQVTIEVSTSGDINFTHSPSTFCEEAVTVAPFGTAVNSFTYQWTLTGYSGGTALNTALNTQNISLYNPTFSTGSTEVRVDYSLMISFNIGASTCTATKDSFLIFHRNPIINTITTRGRQLRSRCNSSTFWYGDH